jgi:predicted RNA-binding Zn ribbon-like protein
MVTMFEFIADRPVLDFVPTLADRGTADEEQLRTPEDLTAWIAQAGIVDHPLPVSTADLERARTAREALFRLVAARIDGTRPDEDDVRVAETLANGPLPTLRLHEGTLQRSGDLAAVLAVLARDCLDLCTGPDAAALHWCADETCTRPFVDRSRGHRRRWCGMKGCGDRAKAAAYRQRRRDAADAG